MLRKLSRLFALLVVMHALTPQDAAAACGGPGQPPCYRWDSCAYTTPSIFGPVCWGGLVPTTSCGGCNCDRLNTWGVVCVPCGSAGEPTCQYGSTCDSDQRYTPFGLCYPCGRTGQATCVSGPACDVGNRPVFGFCASSGFSNEPTTNVVTMPTLSQPATGPVRGIADLHTHQFANLGFGGIQFWGAPYDARGINYALPWCDYTWEFRTEWAHDGFEGPLVPTLGYEVHGPRDLQALSHPVSNALAEGSHDVGGTGPFAGWPTFKTYTHQQMYYKWVERAYLGGVRLMVVHMVSNEALCDAGKRRSDFTCNDMDAVDKQIQAVKDLESAVDRMDDNSTNGSGWYRIAYSPSQARQIIRSGKMAVVMGAEADSLFNCKPGDNCTRELLRGELKRYYALGLRHVFPIHQFDNDFGGAAIFRDELNAGNITVTGSHFSVRDCKSEGYSYNVETGGLLDWLNYLLRGRAFPDQDYYDRFEADCNARGLTTSGRALVEEMMDLKYIIDVDHMSRLMMDEVLEMARTPTVDRPNKYPVVSGHSIFSNRDEFSITDAQAAIIKEVGGMITAASPKGDCGTSADYRDGYLRLVNFMKKDASDQFPGVGFSTDANGFAGATGPRFGNSDCPGTPGTELPYPFTGIMGGRFARQQTGDKTYDFNNTGQAHYGLLADFFADLKQTGMTDAELDPLLNSAETYIRMWEAVDNSDRVPPPSITPTITGTVGLNGWYTSDVTVEWGVTVASGVSAANLSGCGPTTITTDTRGTRITCTASNPSGESSTSSVTIRRDITPPAFVATLLTTPRLSGWTNENVRVRFEARDTISGIGGNATAEVLLTIEGANQTARYRFTDQAGNEVEATFGGINIDKTRPSIGFRFAHLPENATAEQTAAEQARWHNQSVTLLVDAQDELSGIASVTPVQLVFSSEGAGLAGSATATDRAGNSVTDESDPIRIDMTPPTIRLFSRLPAANAHGWNNTPVEVSWECSDALSGVQAAFLTQTISGEGDRQSATQTCRDQAENSASHTQDGIRIDLTKPTLLFEAQQPAANTNGWNRTDVLLPFIPADALSGVESTSKSSPLVLTAEGAAVNGVVTVADNAGNTEQFTSPSVKIDKTAPDIVFVSRRPEANSHGWNNTDITALWTCADGLSGVVAQTVSETLSAEGATLALTGRCVDLAGNVSTNTHGGLNLDKTAPLLGCRAAPAILWPPNGRMAPVDVALTFTDALSGTDSFALTAATSSEAGADISGFVVGQPALSGQLQARRSGSGPGRLYTLGYSGVDRAGNTAACSTTVAVPHDMSQSQK